MVRLLLAASAEAAGIAGTGFTKASTIYDLLWGYRIRPLFKLHFLLSCHYCIGNIHDFYQQAVRTTVEITQHA